MEIVSSTLHVAVSIEPQADPCTQSIRQNALTPESRTLEIPWKIDHAVVTWRERANVHNHQSPVTPPTAQLPIPSILRSSSSNCTRSVSAIQRSLRLHGHPQPPHLVLRRLPRQHHHILFLPPPLLLPSSQSLNFPLLLRLVRIMNICPLPPSHDGMVLFSSYFPATFQGLLSRD